uniref:Retrotransposon protein, putative, Ty1-copia subclass n=1 Tax=Oryza sativa subsp. japonica TaxID=39947 RepID=Q338S6_ORYSJ|nr:retrotransposon protein, putative, Ty1-copia subclass [Oryza sativa Japonica Group]
MVASSHTPIISVMTDAPRQLLHMDTVGPARVQSVGGKWYVLVIVDDFSRYSWVYFMATKDEISHLRIFGCKCFVLKSGNLDKFEPHSTDGLMLGYSAHSRGYRVLVLDTNKIVETCKVTLDEASPGARPEISGTLSQVQGEDIFVEESDDEEDDEPTTGQTGAMAGQTVDPPPVRPQAEERSDRPGRSSPSSLGADNRGPPEVSSSSNHDAEHEISSDVIAPLHIQRRHPPEQIIGNIGECTTRSKVTTRDTHVNSAFVATFEPKDVTDALANESWINAVTP